MQPRAGDSLQLSFNCACTALFWAEDNEIYAFILACDEHKGHGDTPPLQLEQIVRRDTGGQDDVVFQAINDEEAGLGFSCS